MGKKSSSKKKKRASTIASFPTVTQKEILALDARVKGKRIFWGGGGESAKMNNRLGYLATAFGSLCCIVPLILLGVGLGGTMLPMFFVSYKVPFLTVAVTALGLAWILYLRDKKRCLAEGCSLIGSRVRLWMLGGNTLAVVVFILISLTPLGVVAGNTLFPPPDLEALTVQNPPPTGSPGKRIIGNFTPTPAGPKADAVTSAATAAPGAGMEKAERISLRVEGMS